MAVKGLTTPLLRWLRVLCLFVEVRGTFEEPPTGLIPWFSKIEGKTYATIVASPFPLQGKPTQAQDVATTHYPAQCHVYPMVQRTIQQKKEAMKGALKETLEEPVMKEEVEGTPEEDPIKTCTKSCY